MFIRIGKLLLVAGLVATLGTHWALLQTVAWTTMLAGNLCSGSFHDAVAHTFDGKHPCCLCKAIVAGKKSEQQSQVTVQVPKLEFLPLKATPALFPPSTFAARPMEDSFVDSIVQSPLLQPPRYSPA